MKEKNKKIEKYSIMDLNSKTRHSLMMMKLWKIIKIMDNM